MKNKKVKGPENKKSGQLVNKKIRGWLSFYLTRQCCFSKLRECL